MFLIQDMFYIYLITVEISIKIQNPTSIISDIGHILENNQIFF